MTTGSRPATTGSARLAKIVGGVKRSGTPRSHARHRTAHAGCRIAHGGDRTAMSGFAFVSPNLRPARWSLIRLQHRQVREQRVPRRCRARTRTGHPCFMPGTWCGTKAWTPGSSPGVTEGKPRLRGPQVRLRAHQTRFRGHQPRLRAHQSRIRRRQPRLRGHQPRLQGHQVRLQGHQVRLQGHQVRLWAHQVRLRRHRPWLQGHQVRLRAHQPGFRARQSRLRGLSKVTGSGPLPGGHRTGQV